MLLFGLQTNIFEYSHFEYILLNTNSFQRSNSRLLKRSQVARLLTKRIPRTKSSLWFNARWQHLLKGELADDVVRCAEKGNIDVEFHSIWNRHPMDILTMKIQKRCPSQSSTKYELAFIHWNWIECNWTIYLFICIEQFSNEYTFYWISASTISLLKISSEKTLLGISSEKIIILHRPDQHRWTDCLHRYI